MKTYFGITFPADFPLDNKNQRQLAKLLLLNPYIPVGSARKIINNISLWLKISLLTDKLQCEISGIFMPYQKTEDYNSGENNYYKLFRWVLEFTFPNLNEVKEIATKFNVPNDYVIIEFLQMLHDDRMPPIKIIDFLVLFSTVLQDHSVDILLDLYLDKNTNNYINNPVSSSLY